MIDISKVSDRVIKLIKDSKDYIEKGDFESLYSDAYQLFSLRSDTSDLTAIFLSAGIDPLKYMNYVPDNYAFLLNLPEVKLPTNIKEIWGQAFAKTSGFKSIDLSNIVKLEDECFYESDLETITIPGNISIIPEAAFADCSQLRKVILEEGVKEIGYKSFSACTNLEELHLPKSLEKIELNAFLDVYSLNNVYYNGTKDEFKRTTFNVSLDEAIEVIRCIDGDLKL